MPPKLTVESINKALNLEKFVCTSYDVASKKFIYLCPQGHKGSMRMDHWRRGVRCASCAGNKKLSLSYIKACIESDGYVLLSSKYLESKFPLRLNVLKAMNIQFLGVIGIPGTDVLFVRVWLKTQ